MAVPKRVIFHELKTPEEALRIIEQYVKPMPVEYVPLEESYMRVLADDVYAKVDVPPFDRATMDGYAVSAEDTFGVDELHPRGLRIIGTVNAGDSELPTVHRGEAVEIATGAPLPPGANAVIPVEYTKVEGDVVAIYRSVTPMDNVMSAGSDIMMGELALRRCTVIKEREVGVLAAIGVDKVPVFKRPTVAIISTGNEIVPPGSSLTMGKIYDVNTYTVAHGVRDVGGIPLIMGIVKDDEAEMAKAIDEALSRADVVLLSGGTSAGAMDITYRVLDRIGPPGIVIHGLNVKPGKPTVVAVSRGGKIVVGLPGYPSSALMIFNIIVKPILAKMQCIPSTQQVVRAKLAVRVEGARGRRGLYPVSLVESIGGEVKAYPLPAESGAISTLAQAEGYFEVPEGRDFMEEGEWVEVKLFVPEYKPANLYIIGSHDVALDIALIPMMPSWVRAKVINVGSLEGLRAAARGDADIAGIHLVDESSGEYNVPFVKSIGQGSVALIAGYMREQGIIVPRGNPKGIKSIDDIIEGGLTIVNRNRGAGTRFLLDMLIRRYAEKHGLSVGEVIGKIRGYYHEARTHTAVAAAVAQGRADAGIGIRAAASMYGLDFIPLAWEHYDFAVPLAKLEKASVREFISIVKTPEFKRRLESIPGYRAKDNIGEVIVFKQ